MSKARVELEPFLRKRSIPQGFSLHNLTHQQRVRNLLAAERTATLIRYRDRPHAIYNVGRIAASSQLSALLVRVSGEVKGVATVIFDQTIEHPTYGLATGNNLDYWLAPGLNHMVHDEAAEQLLTLAQKTNGDANFAVGTYRGPYRGFRTVMETAHLPAQLTTPMEHNYFDVTNGDRVSQLYVAANRLTA